MIKIKYVILIALAFILGGALEDVRLQIFTIKPLNKQVKTLQAIPKTAIYNTYDGKFKAKGGELLIKAQSTINDTLTKRINRRNKRKNKSKNK
jgi:hypothetical protein